MPPQPVIAPNFDEAKLTQASERRLEILDHMQGTILIGLRTKTAEEESSGFQYATQFFHRLNRVGEVLKNIHRRHHIEGLACHAADLHVKELRPQFSVLKAPPAECQHG